MLAFPTPSEYRVSDTSDLHTYYLQMAKLISTRGTCARRKVGCVLIDAKKHVLATGYNGPPSGMTHCTTTPCAGAKYASGQGLDKCEAVHAEQNALLQCMDVQSIHTVYCTTEPCMHCIKLLLNTSCQRLVFGEFYSSNDDVKEMWERSGREWVYIPT